MISRLRLRDFRCLESLEFFPKNRVVFLVGSNAQGKTSLLEAICVLLRLQSPRTSQLSEAIRHGQPEFVLDGQFGESHLRLEFSPTHKKTLLDSKPQSSSADYLAMARVAWFASSDLELVRGGGSLRRRYLDFLGSQTVSGYLKNLRSYERALRSRNALLKDNRPRSEVEAFNEPLCHAAEFLLTERRLLCDTLAPLAVEACQEIGDEDLQMTYAPGCTGNMLELLQETKEEEIRLRQTIPGPHRDDITLHLKGTQASTYASEGQQRSIALSLKLAQARHIESATKTPPILLIDDVFGELDRERRNRLLAALPVRSQTFITTTTLDWLENSLPDAEVHTLAQGKLTAAE